MRFCRNALDLSEARLREAGEGVGDVETDEVSVAVVISDSPARKAWFSSGR